MQFNSSHNKQESILALKQATKEHKGARALAVRDSNVSKWCLRARSGRWEYEREKHSFYVENSIY
jgi:hypothetical protein